MKKILTITLTLIIAAFITSCSTYTCPTYSQKEAPKMIKERV